jgi:integrase
VHLVLPTASELLGLERRDVEVGAGVLHVRRAQTARSQRSVPMPLRARQALAGLPAESTPAWCSRRLQKGRDDLNKLPPSLAASRTNESPG